MTHMVVGTGYDGPLELLLELSERRKGALDLVSIGQIAADYLELLKAMATVRPDEVADFVRLGCRLTYLKSAALLPVTDGAESERELKQLVQELDEYRRFRAAATEFATLAKTPSYVRSRQGRLQAEPSVSPNNVTSATIQAAFAAVLARQPPAATRLPVTPYITQLEAGQKLEARLAQGPFNLHQLAGLVPGRINIIMLFSAALELIKAGRIRARYSETAATVMFEVAGA